jgi:hypothetical protein
MLNHWELPNKRALLPKNSVCLGWNWNGTLQWVTAGRADLHNGSAVGLKLGGARFRSRSGHICPGKWGAPNRPRRFFFFNFTIHQRTNIDCVINLASDTVSVISRKRLRWIESHRCVRRGHDRTEPVIACTSQVYVCNVNLRACNVQWHGRGGYGCPGQQIGPKNQHFKRKKSYFLRFKIF